MNLSKFLNKNSYLLQYFTLNKEQNRATFYSKTNRGYDIIIEENKNSLELYTNKAYHLHFDFKDYNSKEDAFIDAFKLAEDMLYKKVKIIEFYKNNSIYKVYLKYFYNNEWIIYDKIFFLNPKAILSFKKSKIRIFRN
jgi:hypothetical protein